MIPSMIANYCAPQSDLWKGRITSPEMGVQFWYQAIQCVDLNDQPLPTTDIGLLGYACEEGVRRNQGRIGAAQGPDQIRRKLGTVAYHLQGKRIADLGDFQCKDQQMEDCQTAFATQISAMLHRGIFPIGLGGGHDIAYAHASGIIDFLNTSGNSKKLGIINFDAHFDLRSVTDQPNSGTPFQQLLRKHPEQIRYFPIGIQRAANAPELFQIAQQLGVDYVSMEQCRERHLDQVIQSIKAFIEQQDSIYLTIDLDGFSSAFAPGVSAPSPVGFTPDFFFEAIVPILHSDKLISADLAELNPVYDQDNHTAGLAARIIERIANRR